MHIYMCCRIILLSKITCGGGSTLGTQIFILHVVVEVLWSHRSLYYMWCWKYSGHTDLYITFWWSLLKAIESSRFNHFVAFINIHWLCCVFSHFTVRLYAKGHARFCRERGNHDEENFRHSVGRTSKL